MNIEFLSKNEKFLPTIARWYHEEWGNTDYVFSIDDEIEKLKGYLNHDKIPFILTAVKDNELLGVVQLKEFEMDIYPNFQHWLGGVYVSKKSRKKGVAKRLIKEAIIMARNLNIEMLYLQTEYLNGGLYKNLGWKKLEEVNYKGVHVAVMKLDLKDDSL